MALGTQRHKQTALPVQQILFTLILQRRHMKAIDSGWNVRNLVFKNLKAPVESNINKAINSPKIPPNKKWHRNKSQESNAAGGQSEIIKKCY